jgi:hypothetical protein
MTTVQLLLTDLSNDVQQARIGGLLYLRLKQTKTNFNFRSNRKKSQSDAQRKWKKGIHSNGVLLVLANKHTALKDADWINKMERYRTVSPRKRTRKSRSDHGKRDSQLILQSSHLTGALALTMHGTTDVNAFPCLFLKRKTKWKHLWLLFDSSSMFTNGLSYIIGRQRSPHLCQLFLVCIHVTNFRLQALWLV